MNTSLPPVASPPPPRLWRGLAGALRAKAGGFSRICLMLMAALFVGSTPLVAHHSFSAFNTEVEKTITGTVNRFEWTNPHTWIWVDVPDGAGASVTWGVEGMSPNYLARRGWSKNTFKPGDKVTLTIRPMRDGSPGGMFVRGILADGKPVTFAATEQ